MEVYGEVIIKVDYSPSVGGFEEETNAFSKSVTILRSGSFPTVDANKIPAA